MPARQEPGRSRGFERGHRIATDRPSVARRLEVPSDGPSRRPLKIVPAVPYQDATPALPAKIFGIGLSRTGTTSLHCALALLGVPSIHYPAHAAWDWLHGRFHSDALVPFDACCDIPTPIYFRQLDRAYPGSKFILTTRAPDAWLDSVERHYATSPPSSPQTAFRDLLRVAVYGVINFHRGRFREVYETHHDAVKRYFAARPGDIIQFDVTSGDGWSHLCPFVGRPAPDVPFPKLRTPYMGAFEFVKRDELAQKQVLLRQFLASKGGDQS